MHVTEKIVDENGVHILTSMIEADGPFAICSKDAKLEAKVIALQRTESGGVKLQVALTVDEPKAEAAPVAEQAKPLPTAEEDAAEYLAEKGLSAEEAKSAVERFGAAAVLAKRNQERAEELDALVAKK